VPTKVTIRTSWTISSILVAAKRVVDEKHDRQICAKEIEALRAMLGELCTSASAFVRHYAALGRDEHVNDRLVRDLAAVIAKVQP
jgi:hypothetical protein